MTEAEKNEIVGLLMTQISSQAVDFDIATEEPKANDLLTAARQTSSGAYVGGTIKWDDVARIATELANQAATRAEQAKTNVENMKSSVEQTVTDFNALAEEKKQEVQGVYQSDLNERKGDLSDVGDKIAPIDFRQKSTGKAILDVDITGTMEAFMDGMEQEPNEAIALTLEPDVPTVESHNFGVRGQICIDGNYLYVCVADNTWKKIALQEL